MATDFRNDTGFPRRGRLPLGGYLWLLRVFDKARANAAGTIGDYVYPCPIDRGVMERWGISPAQFDAVARRTESEDALLAWARSHITGDAADRANSWLCVEMFENLDRQDREEGAFIAQSNLR